MTQRLPEPVLTETERGRFAVRQLGQGPDLVMLHGWPQSSYCWKNVAESLADRFRITLPDLRGLGDSERTPGTQAYAKDELARDVLGLLDRLGIESFGLVGHDWGGVVSQELILEQPERVNALALINISVILNRKGNAAARDAHNARGNRANWYQHFQQVPGLAEALIPGNEAAWLKPFLAGLSATALAEYVRCYAIEGTAACAAALYRAFPGDIKRWGKSGVKRLPVRALYIHGTRDPVIIPQYLDSAETCFESLHIERLEAGHFLPEEKPAEVAQLLGGFFRSH